MPARLPDEDLAPAEGTAPPQQVVQPTDFGLERAGQELGQAATVGFRAGAIATRAQAMEDQRAIEGPVDELKQSLLANANVHKASYQGEPGLGAQMGSEGQDIYGKALAAAQSTMTPSQLAQFERAGQSLLAEHQSLSEEIQGAHQATAIGEAVKSQQDAQVTQMSLPALDNIRKLGAGLSQYSAGDPTAMTQFKTGAQSFAQQQFDQATQGLPAWQVANLAPAYWNSVNREIAAQGQRLGDSVTTYALARAQDAHQQSIDTMIGSVNSAPDTYQAVRDSPQYAAAQDALGTSPEAEALRQKNDRELAKAHLQGLADNNDWDVLGEQLKGHDFDFLGPEKAPFENEALKHGENAIDVQTKVATLRGLWDQNVAYHATQGPEGIVSPADMNFLRQNMDAAAFGELQARTQAADRVFAAIGGPIADQTADALGKIKDPDPGLLKSDPMAYDAEHSAYLAAQAQIKSLSEDSASAAWGIQRGAGKVRPSGPPQPGSVAGMGPRLEQEWALLAGIFATNPQNPTAAPQPNPQAGQTYFADIFNGENNADASLYMAGQLRALPKPIAQQIVASVNDALTTNPQTLPLQARRLAALVASAPDQIRLSNGLTVAPKAQLASDLAAAGLKEKGLMAAVLQAATGTTAGQQALDMYVASRANPELQKPLPAQQGNALYTNVVRNLGDLTSSMGGPADQRLNQDRVDEVYAIARVLMFRNPSLSPGLAAQSAAGLVKQDYRFGDGLRMPVGEASRMYDVAPQAMSFGAMVQAATSFGLQGSKQSGWDLAAQGRDAAKAYAISNGGANLMMPPDPGARSGAQTLQQYGDIVAHNAQWKNFGDGTWKYAMLLNNGQYSIVQDKYGREISLTSDQAIRDGQAGASSFLKPATPVQTTTTPAGHPLNAVPPQHAAAAAGSALAADAAAKGAPANQNAPPPPPQTAGVRIVDAPGADQPAPAPAAAAGAPSLNERQALVARAGADPRVVALFGDQPVQAAPAAAATGEAGAAPVPSPAGRPFVASHAGAAFDRLNLTRQQALDLFTPAILKQEHGGAGVKGPVTKYGQAYGLYQVLPSTAQAWAAKLGIPYDESRLLNDNAYNAQIGQAMLNDLFTRSMVGKNPMAGIAVALAAYNAGEGAVAGHTVNGHFQPGYLQRFGDPRAGTMTTDQWIDKLPADRLGQPRDYVRRIYEMTTQRLAAVHGAGPAPQG